MKSLILIVTMALTLGISAQATSFDSNPVEIYEINVLENELNLGNLPK